MVTGSCNSFQDPLLMLMRVCVYHFWNVMAVGRKVLYVILGICEVFRAQVLSYFTKFEHQDLDTSLSTISQRFQLDMPTLQH